MSLKAGGVAPNLTVASHTEAEVYLDAYEALAPAQKALVSAFSPQTLGLFKEKCKSLLSAIEGEPWLDYLVLSFLQNIDDLLAIGFLAHTRRAVLLKWKSSINCVQLVGSMSLAARYAAIKSFTENPDCKIFLMSLKAGGVAPNLTVASHVVGVPVTLNGDLKNQFVETNVGFDTICKVNSQPISNICTDALSAEKLLH